MQLGVIGLGRMGANIVRRLMRAGHDCVVYDRDPKPGVALAADGAGVASDLRDMVGKLQRAARDLGHAPGGQITETTLDGARRPAFARATRSSMAAMPSGRTMSGAARSLRPRGCTTWISAPPAACTGSIAAIA